jgi:hypothetical protein
MVVRRRRIMTMVVRIRSWDSDDDQAPLTLMIVVMMMMMMMIMMMMMVMMLMMCQDPLRVVPVVTPEMAQQGAGVEINLQFCQLTLRCALMIMMTMIVAVVGGTLEG